jgi:hypothetical protein
VEVILGLGEEGPEAEGTECAVGRLPSPELVSGRRKREGALARIGSSKPWLSVVHNDFSAERAIEYRHEPTTRKPRKKRLWGVRRTVLVEAGAAFERNEAAAEMCSRPAKENGRLFGSAAKAYDVEARVPVAEVVAVGVEAQANGYGAHAEEPGETTRHEEGRVALREHHLDHHAEEGPPSMSEPWLEKDE